MGETGLSLTNLRRMLVALEKEVKERLVYLEKVEGWKEGKELAKLKFVPSEIAGELVCQDCGRHTSRPKAHRC